MRISVLAFILIAIASSCRQSNPIEQLKSDVLRELGQQKGVFAVAFKDLSTEDELLINEQQLFHAASTMKTPVMVEVFKQAALGKFHLDDSVVVKNEFKSIVDGSPFVLTVQEDSDTLIYAHLGEKRTISSLVYDMIVQSSNLATNIVVELVDAKKVTQSMRDLGANDIQVLRGVEDTKAYEAGLNNQVTAYDLMLLFEKIGRDEMVSKNASGEMVKILLDQKFNTIIPARLPKDVKVAHKTGWITGVHHDSALVILPDGRRYVLVLLSKELEDESKAKESMASVSKLIYDFVSSN